MSKQKCLTAYECYKAIGELGKSQGCYSRLYKALTQVYEEKGCYWDMWVDYCNDHKFTDVTDLILALEC